jgi:hypothetical protein
MFSENAQKNSKKATIRLKNFHGASILFIGVGGSFKKISRFDRCNFSEGRVSTPTFQG